MGALLVAEWSKCPAGHPLSLSLRSDVSVLVEDTVCEWCKATASVQREHRRQFNVDDPEHGAPQMLDGRYYSARGKVNGAPKSASLD